MHIDTKLRFTLLRSTLAVTRGFRGKRSDVYLQRRPHGHWLQPNF